MIDLDQYFIFFIDICHFFSHETSYLFHGYFKSAFYIQREKKNRKKGDVAVNHTRSVCVSYILLKRSEQSFSSFNTCDSNTLVSLLV
jgi:hypothetical protein